MGGTSETRIGDWRQTYSGSMYWPLDPRSEEVNLADVAHHLATVNRFGGAAAVPYSVAEHCFRCSLLLGQLGHQSLAFEGLFHDAAEGLIGLDMIRPIKRSGLLGALLTDLENRNQREIHKRFGLPDRFQTKLINVETGILLANGGEDFAEGLSVEVLVHVMPAEIAKVDDVMLMTEARDLMAPPPQPWRESGNKPLAERIVPMTAQQAEYHWLTRFHELNASRA